MSSDRELPTDDTLTPDSSETGGIPLGMQAGAKAGGDIVDRKRSQPATAPAGEVAGRGDGDEDEAAGDTRGGVTRVVDSEATRRP